MRNNKTTTQYDVAIIGAGFAGLYLLHRCRQLGLTARVWETGSGVGGTWYWNRYPGARCDTESMQYSYQFDDDLQQEWVWSERFASQPEILGYAEHAADRFKLLDGIDFQKRVTALEYNETDSTWTVRAATGETLTAHFCVTAIGCLSTPNWPPINGYKDFGGEIYHTSQWPHDGVDLQNKTVAVIGTGSSGIQSIPHIAAEAAHLTVFQRTPNYSIPAHNKPLDADTVQQAKTDYAQMRARAKLNKGGLDGHFSTDCALDTTDVARQQEYERRWQHGGLTFLGSYGDLLTDKDANDTLVAFVHDKIKSTVHDPKVAEQLCPKNIIGGKRLCVDTDYYTTYNRDNVKLIDLTTNPLNEINRTGIQAGDAQYDVDIIVVATGFDALTGALNSIDILGKSNASLTERWSDGPSSYLGLAMADFPNLFTVTGPGSPSVLTNMLPTIEQHVEWITNCIAYTRNNNHSTVEANMSAELEWWQHVQEVGAQGIKQSTDSWYLGSNVKGKPRVFTPYLGGFPNYCDKCNAVVANGYDGFTFY